MSKKIKVIDLLNMIAKGEEFPKIIVVKSYRYKWDYKDKCYICQDYEEGVDSVDDKWLDGAISLDSANDLNYEVEIIEEEPEIDIQSYKELLLDQLREREHTNADIYMLGVQINALIKAVKKLDNKINNK